MNNDNDNDHDFRPLPVGWYVEYEDAEAGMTDYVPCPGLLRDENGNWSPAHAEGINILTVAGTQNAKRLVHRPDLAHLPGELEVRVVDGVEYVRQGEPTTRRVLGPDTPFPAARYETGS